MRKSIFASALVAVVLAMGFTSCEKDEVENPVEDHYVYGDTIPGTSIIESQLSKVSHQQFVAAVEGQYYTHKGSYPCKKLQDKVYYSNEKDDTPHYSGTWSLNVQKFYTDYTEIYEWFFGGSNSATLYRVGYSYEDDVLSGITLEEIADSKEFRVLYADGEYLIFETDGKTKNRYNNGGSEFSRIVYVRTSFPQIPDEVPELNDTIDLR